MTPRTASMIAVTAVVGLLLAGAVYLYAVRGPALMVDLAGSISGILCF